jgi:hypothetical protein
MPEIDIDANGQPIYRPNATPDAEQGLNARLVSREPQRRAQIETLRTQAAMAINAKLLSDGQSPTDAYNNTMALGNQFYDSHGARIVAYERGGGNALRAAVAADGRPWLEYPVPGREGVVIRDLFLESLPEGEVGDRCILTDAEALEILTLMDGTLTMAKIKDAIALLLSKLQ